MENLKEDPIDTSSRYLLAEAKTSSHFVLNKNKKNDL